MKYSREVLEDAVAASTSVAGVLRHLGLQPTGGSYYRIGRLVKELDLDTSHFTGQGWSRGRTFPPRHAPEHYLRVRPEDAPRVHGDRPAWALRAIGREYVCEGCGNDGTWQGVAISLQVDHINGRRNDCRGENLRFLCPNCHTQTATYAKRTRRISG